MSFTYKIGYNYHGNFLRKSLGLTSYFRKPEYAILVDLSSRSRHPSKKFHIVTAAHVTSPFNFPKLYPQQYDEFLQFLSQEDTRCVIHVREFDSGKILDEIELSSKIWCDIDKDVSVLHFEDEENAIYLLKRKYNIDIEPIDLTGSEISLSPNSRVRIIGHDYHNEDGNEYLIPASLDGRVTGATETGRYVVTTKQPSVMGLCGGPVLLVDTEESDARCIGMVEARINVNKAYRHESKDYLDSIEDTTLVVRSEKIREILDTLEQEM